MGSRSSSSSTTASSTTDARVATDGESLGVSAGGDVSVNIVPDEAFELTETVVIEASTLLRDASQGVFDLAGRSVSQSEKALDSVIASKRSEAGQLSEQLVKVGVPAVALAFVASQVFSK